MSVRSAAHRFLLPAFISLLPVSLLCGCAETDGDAPVGALAAGEEGEIYAGNRFAATGAPLHPQHEVLVDRTDDKDLGNTASPLLRCCNPANILQNSLMTTMRIFRSYGGSMARMYIADFVS